MEPTGTSSDDLQATRISDAFISIDAYELGSASSASEILLTTSTAVTIGEEDVGLRTSEHAADGFELESLLVVLLVLREAETATDGG